MITDIPDMNAIARRGTRGYGISGVRPSSAAATSARSSGSVCPNATGSPGVSAPEDGRTPRNNYNRGGGVCRASRAGAWAGWLPLTVLPWIALGLKPSLPAWAFMWAMALAIFFGFKWLTWWKACQGGAHPGPARSIAYLLSWPGMDASEFLTWWTGAPASGTAWRVTGAEYRPSRKPAFRVMESLLSLPSRSADSLVRLVWGMANGMHGQGCPRSVAGERFGPRPIEWSWAVLKTIFGAALIWGVVRCLQSTLLAGWTGLLGLVFLLHFGLFHLLALMWQQAGVNAQPIMRAPILATSLADFWGRRWNVAFHQLAHAYGLLPLRQRFGPKRATLLVFFISGLIHELVISLPANGGYGLPTAYFLLQGLGLFIERSKTGRRFGLGGGLRGRIFCVVFAAAPACGLFHPPFIRNVVLPFLRVIGAS